MISAAVLKRALSFFSIIRLMIARSRGGISRSSGSRKESGASWRPMIWIELSPSMARSPVIIS